MNVKEGPADAGAAAPPVVLPLNWSGVRGWLWHRLPLRIRSAWSPYDNWLRGYDAGFSAGRDNMEAKWRGNVSGTGPYANYPAPSAQPTPGQARTERLEDQPPVPGGTTAIRGGEYVREARAPGPPTPDAPVREDDVSGKMRDLLMTARRWVMWLDEPSLPERQAWLDEVEAALNPPRTPCPICPHWLEVHNPDGTCGCGAHG